LPEKLTKFPNFTRFFCYFCTKRAQLHNKTTRLRPGQGQNLEAKAEAKASRPRPKFWPRGLNVTGRLWDKDVIRVVVCDLTVGILLHGSTGLAPMDPCSQAVLHWYNEISLSFWSAQGYSLEVIGMKVCQIDWEYYTRFSG